MGFDTRNTNLMVSGGGVRAFISDRLISTCVIISKSDFEVLRAVVKRVLSSGL
jgi:hypothetical protein